jgi:acyl-CoA reductase-like NAD-dependent aldehyde dehydrogenase
VIRFIIDLEAAIKAARVAYDETDWPQLTQLERGHFLRQLARLIEDNEDLFVYLGK